MDTHANKGRHKDHKVKETHDEQEMNIDIYMIYIYIEYDDNTCGNSPTERERERGNE